MHDAKKIEKLAMDIRNLLLQYNMWQDVSIYYNGLKLSTHDEKTGQDHSNEDIICVSEEDDPKRIISNVPSSGNIFSMVFEGPFCSVMNYYYCSKYDDIVRAKFNKLIEENGLWYEQAAHYNLTCYKI